MKNQIVRYILIALFLQNAFGQVATIEKAAARFLPGVNWRPKSVVVADFTCQGRKQQAILGTSSSEIIIAVFLRGTNRPPEVLRYSAKARHPDTAELTIENLNYDPKKDLGYILPGFQRSRTCKGLNLDDGETDSAYIYWNHVALRFDDWTR